jgi:undecaprenyl-diphosphatase
MVQSLIALDERIFHFLYSWSTHFSDMWLVLAIYPIYLIPIVLIWFWFARRRGTALFAFLTGVFAWAGVNSIISALVHRERPLDALGITIAEKEGIFHRPGGSFPSDHTAFLTAIVVIFWWMGERRVALFLLILELITVVARIVTGLHWPGDILTGMVVGVLTASLVWMVRRPIEHLIIEPLVGIARRLHL